MLVPNISFVIPAYNCQDTISETVDSIYQNNFMNGDEVIIINDCSTDHTSAVIATLRKRYTDIIVLEHKINKGTAAAGRNTGIEHAANELIFCLDADNVLAPDSISPLKEYLIEQQADAAAFGEIHYFKEKEKEKVKFKWILNPVITFIDNINHVEKTPCSSGNYLFTKESWKKAGRCNEFVGGAWDSWAFGAVQLATGAKMVTLPGYFYFHRYGYESTYFREIKNINVSLKVLQILLPYLHLIDEKDVNYIMGQNKFIWYDQIKERPLQVNAGENFIAAHNTTNRKKIPQSSLIKRFLKHLSNKAGSFL